MNQTVEPVRVPLDQIRPGSGVLARVVRTDEAEDGPEQVSVAAFQSAV